jgi:hypothetical protein
VGTGVSQITKHYGHITSRDIGHKLGEVRKSTTSLLDAEFEALLESDEFEDSSETDEA